MPSAVFEGIGTHWQIDINEEISSANFSQIIDAIKKRIEVFDKDYSRFRSDSLVAQMAEQKGNYGLPQDAKVMFDLYYSLYNLTDGAVTPLIGQTLVEAGYDAEYSLQSKSLQRVPVWDEVLDYNFPNLEIKKPVLLDFGAAGKGYLVDIIGELLIQKNIRSFCVDAGGDILYQSETSSELRVGLENPMDTSQVIGVVNIANQSICGSAGNRRKWGDWHHIIHPKTLSSPQNILAVWAIAKTAILADGLTTCLFFVEPERLQNKFQFEYLVLYADFSVKKSDGFAAEFFTS